MKKVICTFVSMIMALTFISGCTASGNDTVATVGKQTVTDGELTFLIASSVEGIKTQYMANMSEEQKKEYWQTDVEGKKPAELIRENALSQIMQYATFAQAAKDNGISASDSEVNTRFDKSYDDATLATLKKDYGVNKQSIKDVLRKQILREKYINRVVSKEDGYTPDEKELMDIFKKDYIKAKHILFMTVDQASNKPLSDDEIKEKEKTAEEVLKKAQDGADFDSLMNEYSEDPGSKSQPGGYVFTEGEMVAEFYEGAKALKDDEISGLVKSSYGYHIIKRVPITDTDMKDKEQTITQTYQNNFITSLSDSLKAKYKVSQDDAKISKIPVKTGF